MDAFRRYYDLMRTIGLSTTEDMIHPSRTSLICRISVPEPVERYFLQGFQRWHIEWVEVVGVEGIVLPTDPVLLSLQTIVGLTEEVRDTLRIRVRCAWSRNLGRCPWIAWHNSMRGRLRV